MIKIMQVDAEAIIRLVYGAIVLILAGFGVKYLIDRIKSFGKNSDRYYDYFQYDKHPNSMTQKEFITYMDSYYRLIRKDIMSTKRKQ